MTDQAHTIRVSMWPDRDLTVDHTEYLSLLRQGLVLTEPAALDGAGALPDPAQVATTATDPGQKTLDATPQALPSRRRR